MVFEHDWALTQAQREIKSKSGKLRGSGDRRSGTLPQNGRFTKDPFRSEPPDQTRRVGYIRVSTRAQTTDRQTHQLEAECDELHIEHVSAVADERPVFEAALTNLRKGDTFVVLDLDRAFRSSIDAMLTAEVLRNRGVAFRILSLQVDTSTAEGELFYTLLAAFAQFERRIISRRTKEGLEAAKRRGKRLGRPSVLSDEKIEEAYTWMAETRLPCAYVAALIGVSRLTLQRGFKRLGMTYPISE